MKYLVTIIATPIALLAALVILAFINIVALASMFRLPSEILKAIEGKQEDRRKLIGK